MCPPTGAPCVSVCVCVCVRGKGKKMGGCVWVYEQKEALVGGKRDQ